MKNIPRVFVNEKIDCGNIIPASRDVAHYLRHVMRTTEFIAFNGGNEFRATISDDGKTITIGENTGRMDPTGNITLMFAPIKRTDELINMATQLGVRVFQPVITEFTTERHVNWGRMEKIAISAAEQSGRNSVPEIRAPIRFSDLDLSNIVFADERASRGATRDARRRTDAILIGPAGGFSDAEFSALDAAGACGISLGKTILRAELAAAVAIDRIKE